MLVHFFLGQFVPVDVGIPELDIDVIGEFILQVLLERGDDLVGLLLFFGILRNLIVDYDPHSLSIILLCFSPDFPLTIRGNGLLMNHFP